MVTKKKSSTTTKRKTATKSRSRSNSRIQAGEYQTFRVTPDFPTFLQPRVSKQTFYWALLLLFIIIMQLVIIAINVNATLTIDSLR